MDISFEKINKRINILTVIFIVIGLFLIFRLASLMDSLPDFLTAHLVY